MIMHQVKPAMMGLICQITRHQPFLRLAVPSRDMLYVGQKEPWASCAIFGPQPCLPATNYE